MSINVKSKRAQITMIFIIGLLILFVVMFLLYIRKNFKPDIKEETNVIYELESGLVKEHVTACIVKVASDALEKAGESGGAIYDYEGGTLPSGDLISGVDYLEYIQSGKLLKLKYGLRENLYCPNIDYTHPNYPYPGLPIFSLPAYYVSIPECGFGRPASDYDGVYGDVTLPKLCPANRNSACQSFAKGNVSGFTIEVQTEDYISSKLDLCVNLTYFNDRFGSQITLQSAPTSRVFIRDENVQVSVSYPIRIVYKNAEPVSRVFDYQASIPVRLGLIYNFVYSTLSKDARDLNFTIEGHAISSPYYRPGFVFKKINNPCTTCDFPFSKDDVFEVYDSNSIVNGKPYLFRAAIQDRRPVIDLIENKEYDLGTSGGFVDTNIELTARDPDDSQLSYTFLSEGYGNGWRESNDVFTTIADKKLLDISLNIRDIGTHPVGVLVKDDAGFFDYQWFTLKVKDTSFSNSESSDCINECSSDPYYNLGSRCTEWCFITSNYCLDSGCLGAFGIGNSNCESCVWPIFDSQRQEPHPACGGRNFADCNALPNDCFWITEKSFDYLYSGTRCVDDRDLHTVQRFTSIVS